MAAVTQTIPNYLGGVSNQPDDKKLPGQLTKCINAYPDPTFGLTKRPGLKLLDTLAETTDGTPFDNNDLDNAKWFYINRDADERYIGCIVGDATPADAKIHIWNAIPNSGVYTKASVTHNHGGFATDSTAGTSYVAGTYLSSTTATDYDVLTIQDTYYITNKAFTVAAHTDPTFNARRKATVVLNGTTNGDYKITFDPDSGSDEVKTFPASGSSADTILDAFVSNTGSQKFTTANLTVTKYGNTLEFTYNAAFKLTVQSPSGTELTTYQDEVNSINDLPVLTATDRVVKILNTDAVEDDYYVKFDGDTKVWRETISPSVSVGLKEITMPHQLVCTAKDTFIFKPVPWVKRLVGDDLTNEQPSFVGKKIQQTFFSNNRLGFLSEDNVILGHAGDYLNLYATTARTQTAGDPIDLSVNSTRPVILTSALSATQGLFLFSKNQQFMLFSADGALSPQTALIRSISNYKLESDINPVDTGTTINFVSKTHETQGFTRVFAMVPQGNNAVPSIVDIGRVVSEYIPATIDTLISSTQNDFIALSGKTAKEIYFYRTYVEGDRALFRAWFNWVLPGNVQYITIDSDTLYAVIKDGTGGTARYYALSAEISMTPEEAIITNSAGQQINPHMDMYTAAKNIAGTKTVVYDSTGDFSKCYIPYTDITTLDPVILIKGDGSTNFEGITESGFTITPTRATDGDGTYFKVPNKDLSRRAADVFVGYKYDFDVTLPKTYFRMGEGSISDYTANLIVSRMKFSVGRSSVLGFKLKSKGREGEIYEVYPDSGSTIAISANGTGGAPANGTVTQTTSGDPLTQKPVGGTSGSGTGMEFNVTLASGVATAITVVKEGKGYANGDTITIDKEHLGTSADITGTITLGDKAFTYYESRYDDPNDIIVKVNGVKVTGWTISGNVITLVDPPGAGNLVKIYLDNWYDIQSVQEPNFYLADDVPLDTQALFTVPIHQKSDNFTLRVFSDSPFPVSLTSMMWEGKYSPRYYRRT